MAEISRRVASEDAASPISTSEVAFERSRRVSLVLSKAEFPIVATVARDHKRALKASVREGAVPDLHERGRLREVEARELGAVEGGWADRLVSLAGITSVPSRSVPQKAHSQISTSEAAPPTGRGW